MFEDTLLLSYHRVGILKWLRSNLRIEMTISALKWQMKYDDKAVRLEMKKI